MLLSIDAAVMLVVASSDMRRPGPFILSWQCSPFQDSESGLASQSISLLRFVENGQAPIEYITHRYNDTVVPGRLSQLKSVVFAATCQGQHGVDATSSLVAGSAHSHALATIHVSPKPSARK